MNPNASIWQKNPLSLRLALVLLLFVIAQVTGTKHLIEHSAKGDNDLCSICDTASHFNSSITPYPITLALPDAVESVVATTILPSFYTTYATAYASRAPPALA